MPISSASLVVGGPPLHISVQVLDQVGNPILPPPALTFADPGPSSTFVPDPSNPAAGSLSGVTAGQDTLTVTCGALVVTLPVSVEAQVPTTLVITSP